MTTTWEAAEGSFSAFYGWRGWKIDSHLGRIALRSVVYPFIWEECSALEATCADPRQQPRCNPNQIPVWDHSCGIYSCHKLKVALTAGGTSFEYTMGMVLGRAASWGRTIVCDDGYKAQFCYPQTLSLGICEGKCKKPYFIGDLFLVMRDVRRKQIQGLVSPFEDSVYALYCLECVGTRTITIPRGWHEELADRYKLKIEKVQLTTE